MVGKFFMWIATVAGSIFAWSWLNPKDKKVAEDLSEIENAYEKYGADSALAQFLVSSDAEGAAIFVYSEEEENFVKVAKSGVEVGEVNKHKMDLSQPLSLKRGDYDVRLWPVRRNDVVVAVVAVAADGTTFEVYLPLLKMMALSEYMAYTLNHVKGVDEVLQVYTQAHFEKVLKRELERAERQHGTLTLLFVEAAEELTPEQNKAVVDKLRKSTRILDVIFSLGNRFAVILSEAGEEEAARVADRLISELSKLELPQIYLGSATYPADTTVQQNLEDAAMEALKTAKERGVKYVKYSELYR